MRVPRFPAIITALTSLGARACLMPFLPGLAPAGAWADSDSLGLEARKAAGVVYVSLGSEPPSLDPTRYVDDVSYFWLGHIYEGLYTRDGKGQLLPGAAVTHTVSADKLTHVFRLRPGAKWHDGKPVKAADFEFAFRRLVDPSFASDYSFIAETAGIAGAAEVIAGKKPPSALGVRAKDDATFEVTLSRPTPFLPSLLAYQPFFPVRADVVATHGTKFALSPATVIGNGPFRLVSWKKDASMRLKKANTYWNAKAVSLSAIESPVLIESANARLNMFLSGGIDFSNLDAATLKRAAAERLKVRTFSSGGASWITVRQTGSRPFESLLLRKALSVGLNRREIAHKIVGIPGTRPLWGVVPDYMPSSIKPGSTFRATNLIAGKDGDLVAARALVAKATGGKRLPPLVLVGGDSDGARTLGEYLQARLQAIFGTKVTLENLPFKTRLQRVKDGDFDVALGGWLPDYEDPMTFLDVFTSNGENNTGGFRNARFDSLIAAAQSEAVPLKREGLLGQAEKLLIEESVGVIPLTQDARAYVHSAGLTGFTRNQSYMELDLRFARWTTPPGGSMATGRSSARPR